MAISPTQRQRAAQARFAEVRPEATTWFWRGYLPGSPGQVGIVVDGDGVEQRGTITGNTQPRLGASVSFKPGQPIGEITLPTVDIVGGGGSGGGSDDGAIVYGLGDPTVNDVPVKLGKFYLDQSLGRLYASMPSLTPGATPFWVPSGPYTFNDATLAAAQAVYSGDIYQGPTDHGIEDAEGGMFYRLNQSGAWVPQFTCCPEVPEPPDATCLPGPYEIGAIVWDPTGPGPAIGIWYVNIRYPCV